MTSRLKYGFATDMPICKKFYCGQGKIQISLSSCTKSNLKNPTDTLNMLILSHYFEIWTGHSTWKQNCIIIYPTVKCVPGHIVKHNENNPQ